MGRPLRIGGATLLMVVLLGSLEVASAWAVPPFLKGYMALYLKPDSSEAKDKAYVALIEKTKCGVCHLSGKNRKERNVYGKAVGALLNEDDKENANKIRQALLSVADKPSNPAKADSPTFGQLIREGKLPAGEPKPSKGPAPRGKP